MRSSRPGRSSCAMGGGGGGVGGRGEGIMRTVKAIRGIGGGGAGGNEAFSHSTTWNPRKISTKPRANTKSTCDSSNSSSSTATVISLSSPRHGSQPSIFSAVNHPIAAGWAYPTSTSPVSSEEGDWECVDGGSEVESVNGSYDDVVFGTVPSKEEVHQAVSSLQQVLDRESVSQLVKDKIAYHPENEVVEKIISPASSHKSGSEDWIEPSLHLCETRNELLSSHRVCDAFHLLQHDPSVKRMVISLSSDKAVWDAVMNNEVVREIKDSLHEDEGDDSGISSGSLEVSSDGSNPVAMVLHWILFSTKAKAKEIFEKISNLFLQQSEAGKENEQGGAAPNPFQEKLGKVFSITVVVLLLVVVTRSSKG